MTFWVIPALRSSGMAYDVKDRIPQPEAAAVAAAPQPAVVPEPALSRAG
jgi:hypothetical protein